MFQQLTERAGVFPGGVNVGAILTEGDGVILVDTGANESNARKVLRHARESMKRNVIAILTTHAHADHFGGHAFVAKRTGAAVYATPFEAAVIRHPALQPIFLFGGASPPAALRQRFVLAERCAVDAELEPGIVDVAGVAIEAIPLDGHSPNQVGFLIDGVFFCGDVVFPEAAIDKYRIPYLFDLGDHLAAMETALGVPAEFVVPGHGPIERDLRGLVASNRAVVDETLDRIRVTLTEPLTLEQISRIVFERMGVPMPGLISYYLLRPTIGAYLTYLESTGEVEHVMDGHVATWRSI